MNINVIEFFRRYSCDSALQQRVQDAEDMYPGSLELREAVVEAVLLPIASELGLPFTVEDLKAYELMVKQELRSDDGCADMRWDNEAAYWLIEHGWNSDEAGFCSK